ncbi:MAG: O-antigen ligase family protein [bacterium]
MKTNFQLSDYLIFFILSVNLYISTNLPAQFTLKSNIHYIQIGVILFLLICTFKPQEMRFNPFNLNSQKILLITVAAFFILSSFVFNISNNSDLKSFAKLITYPLIAYVFFFYTGKKLLRSDIMFEKYMKVFILAGAISSLISIIIFGLGISPSPSYFFTTHGIFVHPNTTSFLYILIIPLAIYFYYTGKINSFSLTVILSLFIIVLLFTYSRAGYLGAFSAVLIFTFLKSRSKKVFIFTSLFIILVASTFVIDFTTAKQNSSAGRLLLMYTAYHMIFQSSSSFLWGYGVYNGVEVFREEKLFFGSYEFVDDPHNFILLSGIQFGAVLPLLALVFVIFLYFKFYMTDKEKFSERKLLNIYLCISVTAGYLINNMLEDVIVYPEYYVMPVFLIFLGYLYYSLDRTFGRDENERSV